MSTCFWPLVGEWVMQDVRACFQKGTGRPTRVAVIYILSHSSEHQIKRSTLYNTPFVSLMNEVLQEYCDEYGDGWP